MVLKNIIVLNLNINRLTIIANIVSMRVNNKERLIVNKINFAYINVLVLKIK